MVRPRIVIIGATSGIAEHCARLWASQTPSDLVLVGRDATRLQRVAADLRVRAPQSTVQTVVFDLLQTQAIEDGVTQLCAQGPVDTVLIAHGLLPEQSACQDDLALCRQTLEVNGISPVLFAEAFAQHLAQTGRGTLAIIGSVAGDRGRQSNYVYGAAKGLVERYVQGLQHRFYGTGVKVVLIKPGPTATAMTAHLQGRMKMADVETVARQTVAGIAAGRPVVYTPPKWALIMAIIRWLPGWVFNRLRV